MGSRTFLFVKNQFILILLSLEKIHFAQNIVYQYDIFGKHQQIAGIYWNNFLFQAGHFTSKTFYVFGYSYFSRPKLSKFLKNISNKKKLVDPYNHDFSR